MINYIDRYSYSYHLVAFIDVLGFKEKLQEFENEAIENSKLLAEEYNDDGKQQFFSEGANWFIKTVEEVVESIRGNDKYKYFVFSDNICITFDLNDSIENKAFLSQNLLEFINLLSDIYYKFMLEGFFIRGGVAVGPFLQHNTFAIGKPLQLAYELESLKANFPRILIQDDLITRLSDEEFENDLKNNIIKKFEFSYINPFIRVLNVLNLEEDDQIIDNLDGALVILNEYFKSINKQLIKYKYQEKIYLKYFWLAHEFNCFIDFIVLLIGDNYLGVEQLTQKLSEFQTLKFSYEY